MRAFCYLFILFNNFFQYTSTNVGKNLGGGLSPQAPHERRLCILHRFQSYG